MDDTYLDADGRNVGPTGKITSFNYPPDPLLTSLVRDAIDPAPKMMKKPKKKLKSLAAWNAKKQKQRMVAMKPSGNGLACPTCGSELIDTTPGQFSTNTIHGAPTITPVHCSNSNCYFRSFREC